ncbi:MAG: DNA polymerase III subunit alpha [Verrucomicrobiae bacterium]|nr:DNA polymerase III subunit alpha [Verrucomicrobiae bacterium]
MDATVRIPELMAKAKQCGAPAVALTDHGNLYGAIEFYLAAEAAGIKPILGCEVYLAPGKRTEKDAASAREAATHFLLLAENDCGWRNLIKLVTEAHLTGFYYKPRIDRELLAAHHQGLIATSACLKGDVAQSILDRKPERGLEFIRWSKDLFGDRFYLEVQNHGLENQRLVNRTVAEWSRKEGIPLVATNDVHYLEPEDARAHDFFICIGTASTVNDEKRVRYETPEFYHKTPQEMEAALGEFPEALKNTLAIAERCNVLIDFRTNRYPAFTPPGGLRADQHLRRLVHEGIQRRYGFDLAKPDDTRQKEIAASVEHELRVIEKSGYVSYFLIVSDFIRHARSRGIAVGPGRGSAAGSIVSYALGITSLDPKRYGLLFERFLNPERVTPPDIDVDFADNRRDEVIAYVREKYGADSVAQICTFGTLGAKAVLRDVARVMGLPFADGDRLAKLVPQVLDMTLEKAYHEHADFKAEVERSEQNAELYRIARRLEGLVRHRGVHAAGVLIANEPLDRIVPLTRVEKGDTAVSQFAMEPLTKLNLLKMDFLGLKTLTVIQDAVAEVERRRKIKVDLDQLDLKDAKTFGLLNRADTTAIFQLESPGMRGAARQFAISSFDDIIALIALYRPASMALIPAYIKRKSGQAGVEYEHDLLKPFCEGTLGIMIYQEQVMQAASELAGYSLGQADILRKAMGKKQKEEMASQRAQFVEGCRKKHRIKPGQASRIFDLIEKFAGYGFNKSHSAAYAMLCYQTAWLKANYTVEYMAAALSNELADKDKANAYIANCRDLGIEVLPPDVNESALLFSIVSDQEIRFGLAAVKNVGESAVEQILAERKAKGPFKGVFDFCRRLDSRHVNKRVIESLVKSGAFDFTKLARRHNFTLIDRALALGAAGQRDRAAGQQGLFGDTFDGGGDETGAPVAEWPQNELLRFEKDLLGFYVSGHPLSRHVELLKLMDLTPLSQLEAMEDRSEVKVGGILVSFEKRVSKQSRKFWATAVLEDLEGAAEVSIYSEAFERAKPHLAVEKALLVLLRVDKREESPRYIVSDIFPLEDAARRFARSLILNAPANEAGLRELERAKAALLRHTGATPVYVRLDRGEEGEVYLQADDAFRVAVSLELIHDLRRELGDRSAHVRFALPEPTRFQRRGGASRSNGAG